MVIRYFNLVGIAIPEIKAYPPLIVYGDGILAIPVPGQGMQTIAWRNSEVIKTCRQMNIFQSSNSSADQIGRQTLWFAFDEYRLCFFVDKRFYHA